MSKRVAVVGCGSWGENLVRVFYELGVLCAVYDVSQQKLGLMKEKYRGVWTPASSDALFGNPEIGAVAIATPASTHHELAREALLAGKDVLVEKPLALKTEEGEELAKFAAERNQILMVGHILHYHPAVKELKRKVLEGALGRIQYIYSNRLSLGKIRRVENILWSFAPHDISMILGLLDEEPVEVSARGANYLHPEIADVTVSQMKFASGVNAHIFLSWLHPFKEQKLVVIGDKQMAVFDDTMPWGSKLMLYPHEVVWSNGIPKAKRAEGKAVLVEEREPLEAECRHFIECITTRMKPITSGDEGVKGLRVLNALQESLDKQGITIEISKAARDYYAHETAIVDEGAKIGKGTKIWHFAHVMSGAQIGENCILGQNVVVLPDTRLGNNVKVQNNVSVYDKVYCEDDVFLGPSMVFTNVFNPRSHIPRKHEYRQTIVRKGATIGANATVVCGYEIGEYAFIGSGSVVTGDVPAYALVYGNPARQRGWMCQCGIKLPFSMDDGEEETICGNCGVSYLRKETVVRRMRT